MAERTIWKSVQTLVRWLSGERAPRRLNIIALPDLSRSPVEPAAAPPSATPASPLAPERVMDRPDRGKIARVFDSAHPVRTRGELFGRENELEALLSATLEFGQHAIIHGARGSGKTSLVRVYGDHADQRGAVVIYLACEPGVGFAELLWPYLEALPAAALVASERARFRDALAALPEKFGPRAFVELVAERVAGPVILIFDEFDRITDAAVKADIAAAMKLLSDALSGMLFVLVGIARDVGAVIDCHPSLRRHMRVVPLGRIEPGSVAALIDAGERSAGLVFEPAARETVARASCGSPFHVRMFCHHAASAALGRSSASVSDRDARCGLRSAIEQWAAMNVEDAGRFVALVEDPARLPAIERIARNAALGDRILADTEDARAMLGDALVREDEDRRTFVFRDSVAPQFLIAYVILVENAKAGHHDQSSRKVNHATNF